jgi:SapC protein
MRAEILNPTDHARLRLRLSSEAAPHFVQIAISEFAAAAVACPILITKDATTGEFYAGAMLGFKPGEPLRQTAAERGGFEPLNLVRDGFFISGEKIAIDRDNPRFSETVGEPFFDDEQQPSVRLRRIQRALLELNEGLEKTKHFIQALVAHKALEPIDISLQFDDGERLRLQGLYTVSLDGLRALPDSEVVTLFRSGYLQFAYTMNVSLNQIAVLAHLRNQRTLQTPLLV